MHGRGVAASGQYDHLEPLFGEFADTATPAWRRWKLRDVLITGYLPVAERLARRFVGKGQSLDDLRQVAAVGLIKAVDRFDPSRGRGFVAFAVPTIEGELLHHFRDNTWMLHVPRQYKDLHIAGLRATAELVQQIDRSPSPGEIAEYLGVPAGSLQDFGCLDNAYRPGSLDDGGQAARGGNDRTPLTDRLGAEDPALDDIEWRTTLYSALACLPERERSIVMLRFFGNLGQDQIGMRFGISQAHVSRLLARALALLRTLCGA